MSEDEYFYKGLRIQGYPEVHAAIAKSISERYPKGSRVLDVAAGTGSLSQRLLDIGFCVHCTSWNDKLQVDAPTYRLNLDNPFRCSDVGDIPFDVIVASEIIEHVENPSALLRSCASALKPDGLLIVTTPNIGYVLDRLQSLRRGYPEMFARQEVVNNRHISMIWPAGFVILAEAAGLHVDDTRYIGVPEVAVLKQMILRLLVRAMGPTSAGATCVFFLSKLKEGPKLLDASTVY